MCLLCGDLTKLSIDHLIMEASSLSKDELDDAIKRLKNKYKNYESGYFEGEEPTFLIRTIMALFSVKAKKYGNHN